MDKMERVPNEKGMGHVARFSRAKSKPLSVGLLFVLISVANLPVIIGLSLQGTAGSFAQYPPWNACKNASILFDFKTSQQEGLLMYVDDGGRFDFMEITHTSGSVVLTFNIVDGRDQSIEIRNGDNVNDGEWHRVEVIRNRMETTLQVDGVPDSKVAIGSDFHFGNDGVGNTVFFGGIPSGRDLRSLTLASSLYEPRFEGEIRNVIYGNCSCSTSRVRMVAGEGFSQFPRESCTVHDPCGDGCVCMSTDNLDPSCDCKELHCISDQGQNVTNTSGVMTHYQVPMDQIFDGIIDNPSGMDARVFGGATLVAGVKGHAVKVDGENSHIEVAGPGHRYECFGDLDKCPDGYTIAMWVNFESPCASRHVYLTNGGHDTNSHGIAMMYHQGNMEFHFLRRNGAEWVASHNNVLPQRWYHVAASWRINEGLMLYVNGELVDTTVSSTIRASSGSAPPNGPFYIGRSGTDTSMTEECVLIVDEFQFWASWKSSQQIKEIGPLYCYKLPMDAARNGQLENTNLPATVLGNPRFVPGKINNAVQLDGVGDFLDAGNQATSCLGDLQRCQYGLTISMWIQFELLRENMYFYSTGEKGLNIYYRARNLVVEAQSDEKNWNVRWSDVRAGSWYYLEVSWEEEMGLQLYMDSQLVGEATDYTIREPIPAGSHLYIGRANTDMSREKYARALIDEMGVCYGDRERLMGLGYILSGRPDVSFIDFSQMVDNKIVHDTFTIDVYGHASINAGRVGQGVQLDGSRGYLSLGRLSDDCLGNLDLCSNGILLSAWIKPGTLREGTQFVSTGENGLRIYYEGGKLKFAADTSSRTWQTATADIHPDEWQFMEFTWHPDKGAEIFINNQKVSGRSTSNVRTYYETGTGSDLCYIGRGKGSMIGRNYANMTLDELEFWRADRDYLLSQEYIQRGKPGHFYFDMDQISRGRLVNPYNMGEVIGGCNSVEGVVNNAVQMNGMGQFINMGDHYDACLGNLGLCKHGITGSMWAYFRKYENNHFYYSNGDGCTISHRNGNIYVVMQKPGLQWEVVVPDVSQQEWHFIEYTWHPAKGLRVYINNELKGRDVTANRIVRRDHSMNSNVYFGRANAIDVGRDTPGYANFTVDEVEIWYADRDYLTAFNYILRGDIDRVLIPLEVQQGDRVLHPNLNIQLHHGCSLQKGLVGNGASLDGRNQYFTLGDHSRSCMGNLDKCDHGLTMSWYMNPRNFVQNGYFISGGPYQVYYRDGRVYFKYSTSTRTWETSTDQIRLGQWQKVDVSWDLERGLSVYVNDRKVSHTSNYEEHEPLVIRDHGVYIGRPNPYVQGQNADFMIDEMDYWYANRDYLWSHGILKKDIPRLIIDMDRIDQDILEHPDRRISVRNNAINVKGVFDDAVYLNGNQQYLDAGRNIRVCRGSLQNCPRGFLTRFVANPRELRNNTWFISGVPLDVYYMNGRLHAYFNTPRHQWHVSTDQLDVDDWNLVDLSWHPTDGAKIFINGEVADHQMFGSSYDGEYNLRRKLYIGRPNADIKGARYPNMYIDDFRQYEARWEYLMYKGLLYRYLSGGTTERVTTTTTTTTTTAPIDPGIYDPCVDPPSLGPNQVKWMQLDGSSWVDYDLRRFRSNYLTSNSEVFSLQFRTTSPEGLLWSSGDDVRNIQVYLKNGLLVLVINFGATSRTEYQIDPPGGRGLNDNQWHSLALRRVDRRMTVLLDDNAVSYALPQDMTFIHPNSRIHIAGSDNVHSLTNGALNYNFNGHMSELYYEADGIFCRLNWIDIFLRDPPYIDEGGTVIVIDPEEALKIISFTRKGSYLRLPPWDASNGGSLEFKFRTVEPNTMMFYNGGQGGSSDYLAVETYDGIPYFVVNNNRGFYRYPFADLPKRVDDGEEHYMKIDVQRGILRLSLDNSVVSHNIRDLNLNLGSQMHVGAVDRQDRLPWHMWTRAGKYFVGCLWGVQINGGEIDLYQILQSQQVSGIQRGCMEMNLFCLSNPCLHGVCRNSFGKYNCDCAGTDFTGDQCHLDAPTVSFNGTDYIHFWLNPERRTHTNDISLRFKTYKPNGLLFNSISRTGGNYLRARLVDGNVRIEYKFGGNPAGTMLLRCDGIVNDNQWHTLKLIRRAERMEGLIDQCDLNTVDLPGINWTQDTYNLFIAAESDSDPRTTFTGYMRNFIFDGTKFFDYLPPNPTIPGINVNITTNITGPDRRIPYYPITYLSQDNAYVSFNSLQAHGGLDLRFMLKTKQPDALLLYNGGLNGDHLGLYLRHGRLYFQVDDGAETKTVVTNSDILNDNLWHTVDLRQNGPSSYSIIIDGALTTEIPLKITTNRLDLNQPLYIGGVPASMESQLPTGFPTNSMFGCMGSMFIDGQLVDLYGGAVSKSSHLLSRGCSDVRFCSSAGICANQGICREGPVSAICDCIHTGYTGPYCRQYPGGYWYMKNNRRGIVVYDIEPDTDTNGDTLVFGFMTWHKNGTLVRIDSANSQDFIETKLVNGRLVVRYDIGQGVRTLRLDDRNLNDGRYHIVKFERDGRDATLLVDDFPVVFFRGDEASQIGVFNYMDLVKVGGNLNGQNEIVDYFNGIIAGVYLNGWRLYGQEIDITGDAKEVFPPYFIPPPGGPVVPTEPTSPETAKPPLVIPSEIPYYVEIGGIAWVNVDGDGNPIVITGGGGGDGGGGDGGGGDGAGGDGAGGDGAGGGGGGGGGESGGILVEVHPGGGGGGFSGGVGPPITGKRVDVAGFGGGLGEGARASGVAGTMIGLLVAGSGLMWAIYKFKPGLLGMGGGGGGTKMNISSPRATTNYQLVSQSEGGGGFSGGGGGGGYAAGGGGGGKSQTTTTTVTVFNGGYGMSKRSAGTQTSALSAATADFAEYFSSQSNANINLAGSGIASLVSSHGIVTRGIQTDLVYAGYGGGSSMNQTTERVTTKTTVYDSQVDGGGWAQSGGGSSAAIVATQTLPMPSSGPTAFEVQTQTLPMPGSDGYGVGLYPTDGSAFESVTTTITEQQAFGPGAQERAGSYGTTQDRSMGYGTTQDRSTGYGTTQDRSPGYGTTQDRSTSYSAHDRSRSRTLSPPPVGDVSTLSHSYQMQNMAWDTLGQTAPVSSNLMTLAAESIRVNSAEITKDGRNVITSSLSGPPQIWDMSNGQLVRSMDGDELSSTDLHLACNDTLLVGQVAELTQVDPNDVDAAHRLHQRKLQIWDAATGQPLAMPSTELCTASVMMSDNERVVLGRTDKFGNGTTIVIWDLLGNRALRRLKYDGSIGFADYISYLSLSKDNRYVVAGFQNSYDGNANFIVFDLTLDNNQEPKLLALDALVEVTAILGNHEVVTGTRQGELGIWSMRTGKLLRQLVTPQSGQATLGRPARAHGGEVTALALSQDGNNLVSTSVDGTVKVWDMETEKLMYTLTGHNDEVWCCAITPDNEFIVTGSRDKTIRLWRLNNGTPITYFNCGMDIFSVQIADNKKTIVALGDRDQSRKLVMLQITRTKVRSRAPSRATSPMAAEPYPRYQ